MLSAINHKIGVGDMSLNSYHDIFHFPEDIDIKLRYEKKKFE